MGGRLRLGRHGINLVLGHLGLSREQEDPEAGEGPGVPWRQAVMEKVCKRWPPFAHPPLWVSLGSGPTGGSTLCPAPLCLVGFRSSVTGRLILLP